MQVYNPYLPLYEYIPDGEPHVFGDRVYLYGSHDRAGGRRLIGQSTIRTPLTAFSATSSVRSSSPLCTSIETPYA